MKYPQKIRIEKNLVGYFRMKERRGGDAKKEGKMA
jgi:hypothetical protein